MFPRLRHLPVRGRDHDDGPVHASGARDHVFDVVGVARAVDVGVVAGRSLVFNVRGRDGNTAFTLLWGFVDGPIFEEGRKPLFCLTFGDGGCKCGLGGVRPVFIRELLGLGRRAGGRGM